MIEILKSFDGWKTHLVAIATIVYAISGAVTGQLTPDAAIQLVLAALGLSAGRDALRKLAL